MSFPGEFQSRMRALAGYDAYRIPERDIPSDFRASAVLIAFWAEDERVNVILTRRSEKLRSHKGQVSFPGGRLDEGESFIDAALRETHEEVGIPITQIEVLGRLDDAWSGARHLVVPVVGWLSERPSFAPNPDEVAEVLVADVQTLSDPASRSLEEFQRDGYVYRNNTLRWAGGEVIGLSADILLEALDWSQGESPGRGPIRHRELLAWLKGGSPTYT